MARQARRQALRMGRLLRTARHQVEGLQRARSGHDGRLDLAATRRIEAAAAQRELQVGAEASHQRRERTLQEMERRRHRVVRATAQVHRLGAPASSSGGSTVCSTSMQLPALAIAKR
jgi:hypothetical protein